jgi:hypothetical protein
VSGPFQEIIERAKMTKAAWEALKEDFAGSVEMQKPILMRSLVSLEQGREGAQQFVDKAKALRVLRVRLCYQMVELCMLG